MLTCEGGPEIPVHLTALVHEVCKELWAVCRNLLHLLSIEWGLLHHSHHGNHLHWLHVFYNIKDTLKCYNTNYKYFICFNLEKKFLKITIEANPCKNMIQLTQKLYNIWCRTYMKTSVVAYWILLFIDTKTNSIKLLYFSDFKVALTMLKDKW